MPKIRSPRVPSTLLLIVRTGAAVRSRVSGLLAVVVLALGMAVPLPLAVPVSGQSGSVLGVEADAGLVQLERELRDLSESAAGVVGVGVIHLETGRELYLHGDEAFPMASTYKVPIAVELLGRVDRGELRLDSMVVLEPTDVSPGSGVLSRLFQHPGVILSLRNLTELMLLISDNSATDVVLRTAGGGEAVTARMGALGLDEIRVDRSTTGLIADYLGVRDMPPESDVDPAVFERLVSQLTEEDRTAAAAAFDADVRDTATPAAMARLLAGVWRAEVVSRESADLLLDMMRRSTTGEDRIRGLLPRGTEVSHKTGTIGRVTNDVGIIHLPRGAGNVVTVVFVKDSEVDVPAREHVIAQISRTIYDYFLFNSGVEEGSQ